MNSTLRTDKLTISCDVIQPLNMNFLTRKKIHNVNLKRTAKIMDIQYDIKYVGNI